MKEQIIKKWNWNNGTGFANWIATNIAHKVLSEFWVWYVDVAKTISRITDGVQSFEVLEEIG